jgi:cell division initiation protein
MMTPQEVASHAFSKATLGGYNMAMVDEFLDLLTEDYTALYNDNAILKNKLKVLSDTVEEYRATDNAMRKTLLAAQQMAESMVSEAEKKKDELVHNAEATAQARLAELQKQIADEERRLQAAKESTASYVREVRQAHQSAVAYLDRLGELTADAAPAAPVAEPVAAAPTADLTDTQVFQAPPEVQAAPAAVAANAADAYAEDPDATRRFEDLQFGKDYNIK